MSITHCDGRGLKAGARVGHSCCWASVRLARRPLRVHRQWHWRQRNDRTPLRLPLRPAFDVASIREVPSPTEDVARPGCFTSGVKIDGSRFADYGFSVALAEVDPYAYRVEHVSGGGTQLAGRHAMEHRGSRFQMVDAAARARRR